MVFENYALGRRVAADPAAAGILSFFDSWRSVAGLLPAMRGFTPGSVRRSVEELAERGLLERSDRGRAPVEAALESWGDWNPAAGFFHFSTKDVRYSDPRGAARGPAGPGRRPPPPLKRLPGAPRVALPRETAAGEFVEVLKARRTWRRFSEEPLDLSALGTLLGLTWGVQGWMDLGREGRAPLKTSPSGGARHPMEVYVLALRVRGLRRGLYHYAAGSHALEEISRGAPRARMADYLPAQEWYGAAPALFLMTAVFPRSQWRYGFPRAYRAVLLEAGHFCQTFCLVATWLGLAPFCSMALADSRIEQDLGVDGVTESVLYAAGVGGRPRGAREAQRPPRRHGPV